jgi:hypothetical protein
VCRKHAEIVVKKLTSNILAQPLEQNSVKPEPHATNFISVAFLRKRYNKFGFAEDCSRTLCGMIHWLQWLNVDPLTRV